MGPFDYTAVAGSGKVGPVNQVNHTSWVAVVTTTDRPKSVRNHCVIELFCGVVCVVTLPFDISVDVWAFVIGLSQISSFFPNPLFYVIFIFTLTCIASLPFRKQLTGVPSQVLYKVNHYILIHKHWERVFILLFV